MQLTGADISKKFTYSSPSQDGLKRHETLTAAFISLALIVDETVPDGRAKAVCMTHLEDAKMWASKGVAFNPDTI